MPVSTWQRPWGPSLLGCRKYCSFCLADRPSLGSPFSAALWLLAHHSRASLLPPRLCLVFLSQPGHLEPSREPPILCPAGVPALSSALLLPPEGVLDIHIESILSALCYSSWRPTHSMTANTVTECQHVLAQSHTPRQERAEDANLENVNLGRRQTANQTLYLVDGRKGRLLLVSWGTSMLIPTSCMAHVTIIPVP